MPVLVNRPGFETYPTGEYPATFLGADEQTSDDGRPWLRWKWLLTLPNGETAEYSEGSSCKLSPKAKSYAWISGLLGRVPEKNEEVDLDGLVGTGVKLYLVLDPPDQSGVQRNHTASIARTDSVPF